MSPDENPGTPPPAADAPPPPAAPAVEPPAAPATPPPAASTGDGSKSDSDRLSALEGVTGNLLEAISGLTDAITNGGGQEAQPQKRPWTHWGSKS